MGKPKFSGIGIVDMQNSVAGTTFSRNAYGTYSKAKRGTPASTAYLVAWQNIVSGLRFDWANIMTDADRLTWYKLYIPRKNNMAERHFLNGFSSFLSVNLNLAMLTLPPIYTAPNAYDAPINYIVSISASAGTNSVLVSRSGGMVFPMAIYATPLLSPGRMSLNQIFSFVYVLPAGAGAASFFPEYYARFGPLTAGQKLFIRACSINPVNGMRSNFTYAGTTVLP